MALTEQGIARAREIISDDGTGLSFFFNDLYINLTSFIEKDEEFVKFTKGTKYGAEFYQKWDALVRLIGIDYSDSLIALEKATHNFLNQQEQYNNMKID